MLHHGPDQTDISSKLTYCTAAFGNGSANQRWERVLRQCFYPVETSFLSHGSKYDGSISKRFVGDLCVSRMHSSGHRLHRTPRGIAREARNTVIFAIATRGSFSFHHLGREGFVQTGEAVLFNTAEPYSYTCSDDYSNICFEISASRLEHRLANASDFCGHTIRLDPTSRLFLEQTLTNLLDLDDSKPDIHHPPAVLNELARYVLDLMVTNVSFMFLNNESDLAGCHRSSLRRRVTTYIMNNLVDPDLSPQTIADTNGISLSYLHRLFQDSGTSVNRLIIEKRLAMCRERLSDPAHDNLSITQIAFGAGFSNAAHFSTRYRHKYGMSPRETRSARPTHAT